MNGTRRDFIKKASLGALSIPFIATQVSNGFAGQKLARMSPESQGVASEGILNFLQAAQDSGLEWHSFMLLRRGKVVAEGWWKPFEAEYRHTLYSLSKSFTSSAIGFLIAERKITVGDLVLKFFPDDLPNTVSDNLRAMTIRHLLTMNTGHETDTMPALRKGEPQTWVKSFLNHPVVHAPGSHFLYNTGATYILGAIIHQVTGQTLEEYLKPRLFQPLGITGYDWEKSPEGLNTGGYGLRITTEDIARFGQLYLQKGMWNGKRLLPESWILEATSKQTASNPGDSDWSQGYGYQFWRCKPGFYRGDGAYGQFCMVMPEQDAVLVLTSESRDLQKSMNVAYETLLPAMKSGTLPENPVSWQALKKEIGTLALPVTKGVGQSPTQVKVSDRVFIMEQNPFGITELAVGLYPDSCVLKLTNASGINKIGFGWEKWLVSKSPTANPFPIANRTHIPSRIAGTATWLAQNTLQLRQKFVETIHGDLCTLVFDDSSIEINFLNSISEKTGNLPETRQKIRGTMRG